MKNLQKTIKRIIKKSFSILTAVTMLAAPCIQPLGAWTVQAAGDVNGYAAVDGTYAKENELNAMSDEEYKKFGLAITPPDEFLETGEPLEDFEPTCISELYVGYMNKSKPWTGEFKVMENTKEVSKTAFDLDHMDDNLIGSPFDFSLWYEQNKNSKEVQTSNSCAIDYNGDGIDEILNVTLYVANNLSSEPKSRSRMDIRLSEYDQNGKWQTTLGDIHDPFHYDLADRYTSDPAFIWEIGADVSKAYAVVTAGDYDGDGKEEAAVYVPTLEGSTPNPYVAILKYSSSGGWKELTRIHVSELNKDCKYNYKYNGRDVPIVSLSTTKISGQDDLVMTVCHPLKSIGTNGQSSTMGIFRYTEGYYSALGGYMQNVYVDIMTYGVGKRMRFPSTVDGDVDGNGVDELIVGGYENTGWNTTTDVVGIIEPNKNYIQLICWDERSRRYDKVWFEPKEVEAHGGLSVGQEMMEPAALTAGALHTNNQREQVFLEGVVFRFSGESDAAATAKERLESGSFSKEYSMPLGGSYHAFISSAYAAKFSTAGGTAEQIVVLSGDHAEKDYNAIFYDVSWIWEGSGPTFALTGDVTNNDYIDRKDQDDDGTFISICPLDADGDAVKVKYKGKSYGWSDPVLYAVLQSPPYWSELQYNSESFGTGEISYKISYGSGSGTEGEWGVGGGVHLGVSLMVGGGFLGNKMMAGGSVNFEALAKYVGSYAKEHKIEESYEVAAAAGEDYAVLMAVPVVVYQYEMWVPEHTLTAEDISNLEKIYKDDPKKYDEVKKYKAGDVIHGHWEDSNVTSTLEPSFSHMVLEEYNELAREYKKNGLKEVTKEMLAAKTIGDPSTYPHNRDELKKPGNINDDHLYISTKSTLVKIGEAETTFSYGKEDETELKNGFELGVSWELSAKMAAEMELFVAMEAEAEAGTQFEIEGGASWISTNSKGTEFSAVIKDLPTGTSPDYQFLVQMAVFSLDGLPTGDGNSKGVYVVGYVVTGIDEASAPPKLPVDLRVFGVTQHIVALQWDHSDYRSAKSYEIFIEEKATKTPRSIGKTERTYFIAENLDPDTEYNFAVKSYTDRGLASSMSRWVRAYTKPASSAAPHFTKYPQNVVIHVPGDQGGHILEAEAVTGQGMDGALLTYQWQQYSHDTLTQDGIWEDIPGETGKTYALPVITQENVGTYPEQIHYRVVATQQKGSNTASVVSKVATLFIERADGGHTFHDTVTDLGMGQESGVNAAGEKEYFVRTGTEKLDFHLETYESDNSSNRPYSGEFLLILRPQDEPEYIAASGTFTGGGAATLSMEGLPRGDYEISGIYPGGVSGGGDDKDYFLASQSDTIHLHVVDTYQISYHLNGGSNDPANPSKVTNESPAVQISPAQRKGYQFEGWYLDEGCTSPLPNDTLDPQTLTGNVDLYAKWEPIFYEITYELNGGENDPENPASYTIDDEIVLREPTRFGYEFKGWYTDADLTKGPVRSFSGDAASPLVFYAKWTLVEYPIDYELNGGYNDPENPAFYTVEDGEILLRDPSYTDHIFQGWYEDAAFTKGPVCSFGSADAAKKTFYAQWTEEPVPFEKDESGAYEIGSYEDLKEMAQLIQSDPMKYAAAAYVQTNNINCEEQEWELPIGTQDIPFSGIYEGYDYYVLGLRQNGGPVGGLFGVISESGEIRNLSIVDFDYKSPAETAGGLAGINHGTIIGCGSGVNLHSGATIFRDGKPVPISTLNSQVEGSSHAGGLTGRNLGTIQDSHSNANVTGKTAGGITGENTGVLRNVYNTGTIKGEERAGGLAGENTADGSIRYGYNNQAVTGGEMTGGIAGYSENTDIRDLWYLSDTKAACGNRMDDTLTVGRKADAEMATSEFSATLNNAAENEKETYGLRDWTWCESQNSGYPMLSYAAVQQQTLTDTKTGIQVSGKIHPGAQLKLVNLSENKHKEDLQLIQKSLKSGSYVKGWRLALQYQDGTYATWQGKLTVKITSDLIDEIKNLRIVQVDEDGRFSEPKVTRNKDQKQLTIQTDTLGSFGLVRTTAQTTPTKTPQKTAQELKLKYPSLKKSKGAASVTQTVKGAKTKVTFTSSNPKVASVSKKGNIRFLSVGTAYITASAAGNANYKAASKKCKVTVIPKTAGIKSLVSKKKGQVIVKSNKAATGNTGYIIQYKVKGKKKVHKIRVKSKTTVNKTIKKLPSKKKVSVRIRAYKTIKGKTYYGKFSKYKTVTVK